MGYVILLWHSLSLPYNYLLIVISRFGFEGWIWVQIASVPDLCILFFLLLPRVIHIVLKKVGN